MNYNQPNIPEEVLWVTNSIIKDMDLKKIKASRKTDTYPDKTFVIKNCFPICLFFKKCKIFSENFLYF